MAPNVVQRPVDAFQIYLRKPVHLPESLLQNFAVCSIVVTPQSLAMQVARIGQPSEFLAFVLIKAGNCEVY